MIDSMIYGDGAGAALLEAIDQEAGILSHVTRSDTLDEAYLWAGKSYNRNHHGNELFIKMHGHEIYKYAVRKVPEVVKKSLEKAGFEIHDVKKGSIHQANEKMDEAIIKRLFKLYNKSEIPSDIMPMMISWAGNSSVATLPTLFDLVKRGQLDNHRLSAGEIIVFASVGAGMNINSMVYRMPEKCTNSINTPSLKKLLISPFVPILLMSAEKPIIWYLRKRSAALFGGIRR